jgi:hypothetical protein
MMPGPADQPAGAGSRGFMRASRADREQVIDVLKTAFAQERLTRHELDARVGQALAARTYADLDALTADIPAGPDLAQPPEPGGAQERETGNLAGNRPAPRAVKSGVAAISLLALTICIPVGVVNGPAQAVMAPVFCLLFAVIAARCVASVLAGVAAFESRQRKRRQLPPGSSSGAGGRAFQRSLPARPGRRGSDPALASWCR